jgi:5'-nucleotidase
MRILVTNDDGINAEGIKILEKIARTISEDVWVIAPEQEQSGAGHSLTINTPLRYRQIAEKKYAVNGTPTDCVLMATTNILPKDKKIDLVLSGINNSQNVAEDITHSGTVAGAMEGTLCDIPAIAFSQKVDFTQEHVIVKWNTGLHHAPDIIRKLISLKWHNDTFYNVNFPNCDHDEVKGIKVVPHGKREILKSLTKATDPKGKSYYWINWAEEGADKRRPDCDIEWLVKNYITITPIKLDLTNYDAIKNIKAEFENMYKIL